MDSGWLSILDEQIRHRHDPWVVLEGQQTVDAAIGGWWDVPGVIASETTQWQAPVWSGLELVRRVQPEMQDIPGYEYHQGVVGLAKIPQETGEVARFLAGLDADATVVVCPRLADPATAGGIIRHAAAMGAAGVLFSAEGASPFDRLAVRESAGAVFRLPVRVADGGLLLRSLKAARFEMLCIAQATGAVDVRAVPPAAGRRALVVGTESQGMGAFWSAACDLAVRMPLAEQAASFSPAANAALLLWEVLGRRQETPG